MVGLSCRCNLERVAPDDVERGRFRGCQVPRLDRLSHVTVYAGWANHRTQTRIGAEVGSIKPPPRNDLGHPVLFSLIGFLRPTVKDGPRLISLLRHDSESQEAKSEIRRSDTKKSKKPTQRCGLLVACFSEGEALRRTRLPVAFLSQAGGKNPVYRPFLLARHLHLSYHGSDIRLCPGWTQVTTSANSLAKMLAVLAELHQLDVLGTRAFLTPTFRVGHLLAFTQFVETDALEAR